MAIKTVIDTNVLVMALSTRSVYHWLIGLLLEEEIELYVTSDILLEYDEILKDKFSESVAANFLIALKELPNVHNTQVYFQWSLIDDDPDDNKFVDCYVASNAQYLISQDKHFSVLKSVSFPKVNIVRIEEFKAALTRG